MIGVLPKPRGAAGPRPTESPPAMTSGVRGRLRESVRREGFRLGFTAVGFAPPQVPEAGKRFAEWLREGRHGEMEWMAREPGRRSDASAVRRGPASAEPPPERTVVVCALNYYGGGPATAPPGGGVVSQYAQGEDYHRVVDDKLRELARFAEREAVSAGLLEPAPGNGAGRRRIPTLVDHGPLLEKAFAERAGIGWIGKHTNVIAERGSSWFFLGEVLLPVALPPDDAAPDRCGSCVRCLDACPTDAIVAPYVVDSRRCISYLTIELRGPIPTEFRRAVGNRIFGCDDCQEVCPWNRFAEKATEPRLAPAEDGLHTETLATLLRLTRDEFRERTRRRAVRRAGYAGFLRNVAVALGNGGDPAAFAPLAEALDHEEPLVRGHAAWALAERDAEAAAPLLRARLARETDAFVRSEITAALGDEDHATHPRVTPSPPPGGRLLRAPGAGNPATAADDEAPPAPLSGESGDASAVTR